MFTIWIDGRLMGREWGLARAKMWLLIYQHSIWRKQTGFTGISNYTTCHTTYYVVFYKGDTVNRTWSRKEAEQSLAAVIDHEGCRAESIASYQQKEAQ